MLVVCVGAVSHQARGAFPGLNGKIVFSSDRDGNREIYVMNADGTNQTNLSNNPALDSEPAWSADGTRIVFVSERDGNREIYKMDANGGNQTRLTNNPARDRTPAWTRDGRIVFDRAPSGISCAVGADVFIMNADGTGEQNITNNSATDCAPNGSATGRVAFSTWRDGNGEIYAMNPDGNGLSRITNNTDCDLYPNWSPDAARIVLVRDPDLACNGSDNDMYVVQVDGSGGVRLTNTPTRAEFFAAWSPAADKIVFDACTNFPSGPCQIYTMSPSGGGEVQLTSVGSNNKPDWQPAPPPPPPAPPLPPVHCVVPRVIGLKLGRARTRIRRAHCRVGRVRRARSRRAGRVIAQSPRPGTKLVRGGRVNLVVGRRH